MGGGDINLKAELMSQLPTWVYILYVVVCLNLAPVAFSKLAMGKQKVISWRRGIGATLASNLVLFFVTVFLMVTVIASYYSLSLSNIAMLALMVFKKLLTSNTLIVGWVFQAAVVFFLFRFSPALTKGGVRS